METTIQATQLQPYPAYKESGVDWLGEIPEHWDTLPLGAIAQPKSDKNHPEFDVLSVYREYGVIPKALVFAKIKNNKFT